MSTEELPSVEEVVKSLTGFDEIAIEQKFREDFTSLSPTMTTRALVFILEKRAGAEDKDAYRTSMNMPLGDIQGRFSEDDEDEQGKD